jgi:hypothetical protein
LISLSWPYPHEKWKDKIPYENDRDWEDVQASMNSLGLVEFTTMSPDEKIEEIIHRLT